MDTETKKLMEMEKRDDGEFWMNFRDFCRQFQEVTICTIGPDFDGDGVSDKGSKSLTHVCHFSTFIAEIIEHLHVEMDVQSHTITRKH